MSRGTGACGVRCSTYGPPTSAISFLTIGIMWINHHMIFRFISRTSHGLLVLNTALLMCIALIPFTTALLAEYIRDPERSMTATVVYGGSFTGTGIVYASLWWYAARGYRHMAPDVDRAAVDRISRRFHI